MAAEPLWHEEQTVALVKRLWSTLAPAQLLVDLWQFSHVVWPLWMAVEGLPVKPKLVLMWQVAHWVESDTLLWNLLGVQLVKPALWQESQFVIATPESAV